MKVIEITGFIFRVVIFNPHMTQNLALIITPSLLYYTSFELGLIKLIEKNNNICDMKLVSLILTLNIF